MVWLDLSKNNLVFELSFFFFFFLQINNIFSGLFSKAPYLFFFNVWLFTFHMDREKKKSRFPQTKTMHWITLLGTWMIRTATNDSTLAHTNSKRKNIPKWTRKTISILIDMHFSSFFFFLSFFSLYFNLLRLVWIGGQVETKQLPFELKKKKYDYRQFTP